MQRLPIYVHSPVLPDVEKRLADLSTEELFTIHVSPINPEVFPKLWGTRPCILLIPIYENKTALTMRLLKELQALRVALGGQLRDPSFRVVVVSQKNETSQINWASLGVYELMLGVPNSQILAFKLTRHYHKAIAAGKRVEVAPLFQEKKVLSYFLHRDWKILYKPKLDRQDNFTHETKDKMVNHDEPSSQIKAPEQIVLQVQIKELREPNHSWKSKGSSTEEWEWTSDSSEPPTEPKQKLSFIGKKPTFNVKDGTWTLNGSTPILTRSQGDSKKVEVLINCMIGPDEKVFVDAKPGVEVLVAKKRQIVKHPSILMEPLPFNLHASLKEKKEIEIKTTKKSEANSANSTSQNLKSTMKTILEPAEKDGQKVNLSGKTIGKKAAETNLKETKQHRSKISLPETTTLSKTKTEKDALDEFDKTKPLRRPDNLIEPQTDIVKLMIEKEELNATSIDLNQDSLNASPTKASVAPKTLNPIKARAGSIEQDEIEVDSENDVAIPELASLSKKTTATSVKESDQEIIEMAENEPYNWRDDPIVEKKESLQSSDNLHERERKQSHSPHLLETESTETVTQNIEPPPASILKRESEDIDQNESSTTIIKQSDIPNAWSVIYEDDDEQKMRAQKELELDNPLTDPEEITQAEPYQDTLIPTSNLMIMQPESQDSPSKESSFARVIRTIVELFK